MLDNRTKLLQQLFDKPSTPFHIRLLAQATGLHPNTVITLTDNLEKEGLIKKQKDKTTQRILIQLNSESKLYTLEKLHHNLKTIFQSGLIDYVEKELDYPTIVLFGSYAKAENHERSDIDLFIITSNKKHMSLDKFERKLHTSIQVFMHTNQEVKTLMKKSPELINNVINGVVLSGYLEILR